jgi:two-component system sensor histidine kinase KdpD
MYLKALPYVWGFWFRYFFFSGKSLYMPRVLPRLRSTTLWLLAVAVTSVLISRVVTVNATTAGLLFLLEILLIATVATLVESVIVSIAAAVCFNVFFLPPLGRLTIADPQNWVALLAFLATALVASTLSTGLRAKQAQMLEAQRNIERLYALSRSMLLASDTRDVRRLIINKLIELFGFSQVALYESATGAFQRSRADSIITEEMLRQTAVRGAVAYFESRRLSLVPITLGGAHFGGLGFVGARLTDADLQALANTIALALAQYQAREAQTRADAVRKSEELKSVLIDALAHDLKTPLTAIDTAADLLVRPQFLSEEQRRDLLAVIREEVGGLKRMMGEAIHLARLDAKRLRLEYSSLSVEQIAQQAIESLGALVGSHHLALKIPLGLPLVHVDPELLAQALKQLIDNAAKYSPTGSEIRVSAEEAGGLVSISVTDQGPGLTPLEQSRVFDKFYRGEPGRTGVQGTGMGLAIAREIVEAHGGHLRVESNPGLGSRFTISLPAEAQGNGESVPKPEPDHIRATIGESS